MKTSAPHNERAAAHANVTLYDVSRHSGVSIATVSRVINNSPLVKDATRDKVNQAMRQLGFRPSYAARALAGHQTKTMGVILPDMSSGFYAQVLKGIDLELAKHDFHVLTTFSHSADDEKTLTHRILNEQRTDALILMNLELPDNFIREITHYGIPLILLDRPSMIENISSVSINNELGIEQILEHLSRTCGYRTLGIISGPPGTFDADKRLAACQLQAEKFGMRILPGFMENGNFDYDSGFDIMMNWIDAKKPLPDAIIALNDLMAIGCINACRERGIDIPGTIGVVGFDDIESSRFLGLTTVHVPLIEIGTRAAELAMAATHTKSPARHVVIDTTLVVRSTCRKRDNRTSTTATTTT